MSAIVSSLWDFVSRSRVCPGEDKSRPLELVAVPGLMTLLDVALYEANEGQLTATVCAAHALLCAWIDLKQQAQCLLQVLFREESPQNSSQQRRAFEAAEAFARLCLDAASDAMERLSQDKLAHSANLSDPHDFGAGSSGGSTSSLLGVGSQGVAHGVLESIRSAETGRGNQQTSLKTKDCWESPRLLCPDYVWADDALLSCQRLLRTLTKHSFYSEMLMEGIVSNTAAGLGRACEREARLLVGLIKEDLPMRLHQFRCAMDADAVVSKRLYLVKCEYRAPFRAFLEAHQTVQRAPPIEIVDEYIALQKLPNKLEEKRAKAKSAIQECLESPALVEALTLEQHCEQLEVDMAQALFPFSELARILDTKRARLKAIPGILDSEDIPALQETLRRLKCLLCRKSGPETSTGIRPLLLDLQGVPREETLSRSSAMNPFGSYSDLPVEEAITQRLDRLLEQLQCLGKLCKNRNFFHPEKKGDMDIPSWVVKGCSDLDAELFRAQHEDWYAMVKRQRELADASCSNGEDEFVSFESLSENLHRAEIEMSIAVASEPALGVVRQRLELIDNDRKKRFDVLKEMTEEVCLREMNLHICLSPPVKDTVLELPETSALGLFGVTMQMVGETLPTG